MTISAISGIPTVETGNLQTTGDAELDQDDFMTLFITQLQHQDPMEPMNSTDMASQMAEFSNMEATMKMANNMEELLEYTTSQNNLQLLTLLDQDVRVYGNSIGVNEGEVGSGEYVLSEDADVAALEILDAGGRLVKVEDLGSQSLGSHEFSWDGMDMMGVAVPDGAYSFNIKAYTASGQEVAVDYLSIGKVTGVDYATGSALLVLDHHVPAEVGAVLGVI